MTRKSINRTGIREGGPGAVVLAAILAVLAVGPRPASAAFEQTAVSPRARAMGESAVATTDAAFAVAHNPAALGDATGTSLAATYVQPYGLDFARLAYVSAAVPIPGAAGHLGLAVSSFDLELDQELTRRRG